MDLFGLYAFILFTCFTSLIKDAVSNSRTEIASNDRTTVSNELEKL
jgi:hypothetical protein